MTTTEIWLSERDIWRNAGHFHQYIWANHASRTNLLKMKFVFWLIFLLITACAATPRRSVFEPLTRLDSTSGTCSKALFAHESRANSNRRVNVKATLLTILGAFSLIPMSCCPVIESSPSKYPCSLTKSHYSPLLPPLPDYSRHCSLNSDDPASPDRSETFCIVRTSSRLYNYFASLKKLSLRLPCALKDPAMQFCVMLENLHQQSFEELFFSTIRLMDPFQMLVVDVLGDVITTFDSTTTTSHSNILQKLADMHLTENQIHKIFLHYLPRLWNPSFHWTVKASFNRQTLKIHWLAGLLLDQLSKSIVPLRLELKKNRRFSNFLLSLQSKLKRNSQFSNFMLSLQLKLKENRQFANLLLSLQSKPKEALQSPSLTSVERNQPHDLNSPREQGRFNRCSEHVSCSRPQPSTSWIAWGIWRIWLPTKDFSSL